ncbi:MAG: hypothetical protein GYA24_17450, partial [Candidatus Lokiarchaeota archaeon]|nr:hypothetical protein [Candidatus Lokiarchaeota archaeon]
MLVQSIKYAGITSTPGFSSSRACWLDGSRARPRGGTSVGKNNGAYCYQCVALIVVLAVLGMLTPVLMV